MQMHFMQANTNRNLEKNFIQLHKYQSYKLLSVSTIWQAYFAPGQPSWVDSILSFAQVIFAQLHKHHDSQISVACLG